MGWVFINPICPFCNVNVAVLEYATYTSEMYRCCFDCAKSVVIDKIDQEIEDLVREEAAAIESSPQESIFFFQNKEFIAKTYEDNRQFLRDVKKQLFQIIEKFPDEVILIE